MELVDTHCHIQSAGKNSGERVTRELWSKVPNLSREQIIENALEAGVNRMICVGCDLADSHLAVEFVQSRPNCWASVGIHPHEAKAFQGSALQKEFSRLSLERKVVAIGECGLDYFYEHSPKEAQIEILKFQIELALKNNLPMIFHVRSAPHQKLDASQSDYRLLRSGFDAGQAFDDFWPIFESYKNIRGVLHSFTDSRENLQRALKHNLYIGVNGIATFAKNPAQLEVYKSIPLENLLLETDAPFLTPAPFRGTINEPKHTRTIAGFLSDLRGEGLDNLASTTTNNARTLFGI